MLLGCEMGVLLSFHRFVKHIVVLAREQRFEVLEYLITTEMLNKTKYSPFLFKLTTHPVLGIFPVPNFENPSHITF